jgi:hypothetical protein
MRWPFKSRQKLRPPSRQGVRGAEVTRSLETVLETVLPARRVSGAGLRGCGPDPEAAFTGEGSAAADFATFRRVGPKRQNDESVGRRVEDQFQSTDMAAVVPAYTWLVFDVAMVNRHPAGGALPGHAAILLGACQADCAITDRA